MDRAPATAAPVPPRQTRGWRTGIVAAAALALAGCAGMNLPSGSDFFSSAPPPADPQAAAPIGTGKVKVALVLPFGAGGNAGAAGQSMRNAAEMALAEFNNPDLQLLVKDDAGTAQGAQAAVQQALDEGAEIILGPLFAHSVGAAGQAARARNVPVIAFSTDSNVATRGVFLLSFLPESDVDRVISYAVSQGKRSFVGLLPDNAYGSVVEAEFKQVTARRGARVVALERYSPGDQNRVAEAARLVAQAAGRADAVFIADGGDSVPAVARALTAAGVNLKRLQPIGTGLWDDPAVFAEPSLEGGWFAAPDSAGFKAFATRYRSRYQQEPVRTATLAYDATALVAALVKTQGPQRFAESVLTNPSGFAGVDGVFRFKADGTNQRALAVQKVTPQGGVVIAPAPKSFTGS
jgi:ABC-type branched-subunit amino acid transport system substrate-binding protein